MSGREKIVITDGELEAWKADTYNEYASQSVNGKRLRFRVNMSGAYYITYGSDTLYFGADLNIAKRVWRDV